MSALAEYVDQLGSADEAARIDAAEDIGSLNMPDGVPALLARMRTEPSVAVRDAISHALIRIDGARPIQGAIALLASDDPRIRNQAVAVLQRKGVLSIPSLRTAMRDGDRDTRILVLNVLGGIEGVDLDACGDLYAAALADPEPNVVITAVENLGRRGEDVFRSRIEALLRADAHPMLIAACLEALGEIGREPSLDAIRRIFPELGALPDFLLAPCLKALATLGSGREFREVAGLLTARGPHLRPAILGALLSMYPRCEPSPEAGEALLSALRVVIESDDPPLCRYQAVRLMGVWAARDDVSTWLVTCLSDAERFVRLGAAESLRLIERPGLKPVLAAHTLNESDEDVLHVLQGQAGRDG
jgi:HEAT repeat protein